MLISDDRWWPLQRVTNKQQAKPKKSLGRAHDEAPKLLTIARLILYQLTDFSLIVWGVYWMVMIKAACLSGSSLDDTAFGLRCSMPKRCNRAIRPERLS
jgi:hypothetical protein